MPLTTEDLVAKLNEQHTAVMSKFDATASATDGLATRLSAVEQSIAAGIGGGGLSSRRSWGVQVALSDGYKQFTGPMGSRGTVKISIKNEISTVTGSDSIAPPDFQPGIVGLPQRRMTVRSLLAPGRTQAAVVKYVRQTDRNLNAAPVAEGAEKPESDLVFETLEAGVKTIAHWIPVSRQTFEDVPALESMIDSELRYGVALAEENQLLAGDGTGENVLGLITQATPYEELFEVENQQMLDVLLLAVAQAELSLVPADGIIVNALDWRKMQTLKDGQQRYIGGGPFSIAPSAAWNLPVVATTALQQGEFLVGGFKLAAQIFDRLETEVLVSSEDRDNFIKNMLTVRAEERLALAVKRPQAMVYGTYPSGL